MALPLRLPGTNRPSVAPPALPLHLAEDLERARTTQLQATRLAQQAARQFRQLAHDLADAGFGLTDIAAFMEVSPARVRQLLDAPV